MKNYRCSLVNAFDWNNPVDDTDVIASSPQEAIDIAWYKLKPQQGQRIIARQTTEETQS